MVQRVVETEVTNRQVSYKCDVCKKGHEYKKDALKCEKTPAKPFKFEIGDRMDSKIAGRVGMVIRRYYNSPAPYHNGYIDGMEWFKEHPKIYDVAIEHSLNINRNYKLNVGLLGKISSPEEHLKKIGVYESDVVKRLRKINPRIFKLGSLESQLKMI